MVNGGRGGGGVCFASWLLPVFLSLLSLFSSFLSLRNQWNHRNSFFYVHVRPDWSVPFLVVSFRFRSLTCR